MINVYKFSNIYVSIITRRAYHYTTRSASHTDYITDYYWFYTDYYCYFTVPKMIQSDLNTVITAVIYSVTVLL